MPYQSRDDLPDNVKHVLPAHAQDIYQQAFNSAWDQYKDKQDRRDDESQEEVAHKVAWSAVKEKYAKGDDDKWHPKK
ncbi:cation transport regulator [Duffyella gerundensis]|jgi:cation transport regulator|uniref:Cation transport regulator chaB n=1 Tax=Duffyella gerundensis TaxID=1619313 RepID=A0A0U5L531_9GAMM|nr:putative cation transport regulator ChaB [Duffyella gerundensis]UCB31243.1 cation transport regulator [Duffyella gerundensis]CUU23846.1 Cation transport regulator chaB [Duffyella gerundensis]